MAEPHFFFVYVDVSPEDADWVSNTLFELGAEGVEERDDQTLLPGRHKTKVTLVASFVEHELALLALKSMQSAWNPTLEELIGDGFRDAWKKHFHPFHIGKNLVITPPWESYEAKTDEKVLVLEPGRAFGTGLHETTALVGSALEELVFLFYGKAVLDVGAGSGILGLSCLKLGAKTARLIDNDLEAVQVAIDNAKRNDLLSRAVIDATNVLDLEESYPLVLANIEAQVLIDLAKPLMARVEKNGLLVLSGILLSQKEMLLSAYELMTLRSVQQKGEWIMLIFGFS